MREAKKHQFTAGLFDFCLIGSVFQILMAFFVTLGGLHQVPAAIWANLIGAILILVVIIVYHSVFC